MIKIVTQLQKAPVAVKASFAFFVGSIITKALVYITMPIYTRLMSASEFGKASVYYTWQNVFGIFAMFCLYMGVFNNGMSDFPDKLIPESCCASVCRALSGRYWNPA